MNTQATWQRMSQRFALCAIFAALVPACCPAAPAADRNKPPINPKINPDREIVFDVESLGCSLVSGVGCGHLLAPALADIDRMNGVSLSHTNWPGTRLRISIAPTADREEVAARVHDHLASQQYKPRRVAAKDLSQALEREQWRGADRVHELSSFEFRTYSRQRVKQFAQREKLEKATADKLLRTVDELWEKSGKEQPKPPTDHEGYRAYWDDRIACFKAALLARARDLLPAEQVTRLAEEAERRSADQ
jgi:hypothetical protein